MSDEEMKAYDEGYRAQDESENTYEPESKLWNIWLDGWAQCQLDSAYYY